MLSQSPRRRTGSPGLPGWGGLLPAGSANELGEGGADSVPVSGEPRRQFPLRRQQVSRRVGPIEDPAATLLRLDQSVGVDGATRQSSSSSAPRTPGAQRLLDHIGQQSLPVGVEMHTVEREPQSSPS